MKTIVTLTMSPAIDKSSSVEHVFADRKLYCKAPRFEPGGGGIYVTRAIKKLGGESVVLYPSGGPTGEMLRHLLEQEGLDHRPIPSNGWTRESLVILEESTRSAIPLRHARTSLIRCGVESARRKTWYLGHRTKRGYQRKRIPVRICGLASLHRVPKLCRLGCLR
jgi:hypothetical protein